MKKRHLFPHLLALVFGFSLSQNLSGQPISIGFRDSLESNVLNEMRSIFIRLPEDYSQSNISYPVLFRLDGDLNLFVETVGTINRLVYLEEVVPEMIVVLIKNTDRLRDMWPVRSESGPANFQKFLDSELIPFIDKNYRTSGEGILCGQSLSTAFVLYSFLNSPASFNSWIACSAGFPGGEEFFFNLANEKLNSGLLKGKTLFMTNGLSDSYDPEQKIHGNSFKLFNLIESAGYSNCKYMIYENEGHVPFQSLYHGLKYIYEPK